MINTRVYVSVLIRNNEDKFLILKRSATTRFAPNQWEFVNGTIELDETAEETAIREIREETGLSLAVTQLKPSSVHEVFDVDGRWIVIPYRAETTGEVIISEEHQTFRWVTEDELVATLNVGDDYQKLLKADKTIGSID